MFPAKGRAAEFIADLLATKSTSVTAAVVLACTFLPISGGAVKPYEVQEFRAGITALMNGETSTPTPARVRHPDWDGEVSFASASAAMPTASAHQAEFVDEANVELAGSLFDRDVELTPVIQTFDEPEPLYAEGEDLALEEAELMEIPELEEEQPMELELG
jgi:hypothetical protein